MYEWRAEFFLKNVLSFSQHVGEWWYEKARRQDMSEVLERDPAPQEAPLMGVRCMRMDRGGGLLHGADKGEAMSSLAVDLLKKKWFELASREDYPKTPEITKQMDEVYCDIKRLEK